MAREIEVKFEVGGFEQIRKRLKTYGARLAWEGEERTVYFDSPNLRLRENGKTLRLRHWPGHSSTITFKNKNIPENNEASGKYKIREETQVEISSFFEMEELLKGLGFLKTICYTKVREHWRIGKAWVELDELKGRFFVEIEGSEREIERIAKLLGLDWSRTTTKSYTDILKENEKR